MKRRRQIFFPKWQPQLGVVEENKEEDVQIPDDKDVEIEGLIREYKKNAKPIWRAKKILEFYGGEDWRTNEGAEMSRCI